MAGMAQDRWVVQPRLLSISRMNWEIFAAAESAKPPVIIPALEKLMTIDEFRKANPEAVAKLEADIKAKAEADATEKPASLPELKAAFPGQSDFILTQAEALIDLIDAETEAQLGAVEARAPKQRARVE